MSAVTLLDTGPLVALLNKTEKHHARMARLAGSLKPPLVTAEPVLTEACFLLRSVKHGPETVLGLVREGFLSVGLSVVGEASALELLVRKYADLPMSLADACLVRLAEHHVGAAVLTFDRDFSIYRAHGRRRIQVLDPRSA